MVAADFAIAAIFVSVMPDSDTSALAVPVSSFENQIEQFLLSVLKIPPQRVGAEIRNLDHACQFGVYKQRSFDDMAQFDPECPFFVETLHQIG